MKKMEHALPQIALALRAGSQPRFVTSGRERSDSIITAQ